MIIQPKIRGFICTAAHPLGCFRAVANQVNYVKSKGAYSGPKNVLVIGSSTGYGLATRIDAAFGGELIPWGWLMSELRTGNVPLLPAGIILRHLKNWPNNPVCGQKYQW